MNELALFAGAGGGILGGKLLGWRTVCAVEIDDYARSVLIARQNDGCLPTFPIWDDITTFDGRPWRGIVDVVSGGFPCQDISAAGRGAGITGSRSGLWAHMARVIGEVRPRYCFVENSPLLVSRGLDTVLSDLAEMGFNAQWGIVGAHHVGAPHKRDRIWIVDQSVRHGQQPDYRRESVPDEQRDSAPHARGWTIQQPGADGAGNVADAQSETARRLSIRTSEAHPRLILTGEAVADANRSVCDGWADQPERGPQGRTVTGGRGEDVADADKLERGYTAAGWAAGAESDDQGEGLAAAERAGLEGHAGDGADRHQPGRDHAKSGRPTGARRVLPDATDAERNGRGYGPGRREQQPECSQGARNVADANSPRRQQSAHEADSSASSGQGGNAACGGSWWQSEPDVGRVAYGLATGLDVHGAHAAGDVGRVAVGVPDRAARLRCIGNGQVPAAAATAWRLLTDD